jgi:putative oxidoreductase
MTNKLFTAEGFWKKGAVLVRIITGIIILVHGLQLFDQEAMKSYGEWLGSLGVPAPETMAFLGKGAELAGGISLILGLLTRWMMIPLIITMVVIIFVMGKSEPLGNDQHPFLLLLLFLFYCLAGPGKWSLDYWLFDRVKNINQ